MQNVYQLALNTDSNEEINSLILHKDWFVRRLLALNYNTPRKLLECLRFDNNSYVRKSAEKRLRGVKNA